ncbi:hypothetical protein J5J10_09240 [Ciceribacter sp. L1K23]|uniref:hypothetical protein n=1 Tax=Ciceribacter sp. L1K23 TaxID=2820276 RepID=UPI001B840BC9|nr:hypothetical protein [Ciceribacter sp. L1K23]MBR0555862.1 hypothetical protein [Ciceribacter sp. L1K23]
MKKVLTSVIALCAFAATGGLASAEEAHVAPVTAYVQENVVPWLSDPAVIAAIKAQNEKHAGLSAADIDALDKKWRAEVETSDRPMISEVLGNDLSKMLQEKQMGSEGTISELFVMDNKGLNVGQSDVTSDYWQGDEDKFNKSFGAGKDAIFVDAVEKDESTQALQSQASVTISDESGAPIGAITIGINMDAL